MNLHRSTFRKEPLALISRFKEKRFRRSTRSQELHRERTAGAISQLPPLI